MGYEKSKIYMLCCDDGHYYYGSTTNELRFRLHNHKSKSTLNMDRRLYKHINNNWNAVRIVLVEEFSCENRQQLLQRENHYIMQHKHDPLCLNVNPAILTERERIEYNLDYNKRYKETHPEYAEWCRNYHREYMRQYRQKKKVENNKDVGTTTA